ncbi:hypothetical protein OCV51_04300 [Faecalicatena acetigenes]|uniref:Uncharacterized protein n=1 Tax=Faecalicatena acetigenes TaxID=2981790 RepID=A0ABT2T9D7_9FIRM|nr:MULTISPECIES: hypothetical protein [Lachnospiraceae]MCU6746890.1 hypothetical protein [Faecalicatena acetigenes]SCH49606.1 Uncharacterised protein [uncultured Clostridium sp.]
MKKDNERTYIDEKILDSAIWEDRECLYLLEKMIGQGKIALVSGNRGV